MRSTKVATAPANGTFRFSDGLNELQSVFDRTEDNNIFALPRRKAKVIVMPTVAARFTTAARTVPARQLIQDFRNVVQELIHSAERSDRAAVATLVESLDGCLLDALYGPKRVA